MRRLPLSRSERREGAWTERVKDLLNLFTMSGLHTKAALGPSDVSNGRIRRRAFECVTPNCQGQRMQIPYKYPVPISITTERSPWAVCIERLRRLDEFPQKRGHFSFINHFSLS